MNAMKSVPTGLCRAMGGRLLVRGAVAGAILLAVDSWAQDNPGQGVMKDAKPDMDAKVDKMDKSPGFDPAVGGKKSAQKWVEEVRPPRDVVRIAGQIDRVADAMLARAAIPPSPQADDAEFLRRATLDLIGRIPTIDESSYFFVEAMTRRKACPLDRWPARLALLRRALRDDLARADAAARQWREGRARRIHSLAHGTVQPQSRLGPHRHGHAHSGREDSRTAPIGIRRGEQRKLRAATRPAGGRHGASLLGRATPLRRVPRSSVRALDAAGFLGDGGLLQPAAQGIGRRKESAGVDVHGSGPRRERRAESGRHAPGRGAGCRRAGDCHSRRRGESRGQGGAGQIPRRRGDGLDRCRSLPANASRSGP